MLLLKTPLESNYTITASSFTFSLLRSSFFFSPSPPNLDSPPFLKIHPLILSSPLLDTILEPRQRWELPLNERCLSPDSGRVIPLCTGMCGLLFLCQVQVLCLCACSRGWDRGFGAGIGRECPTTRCHMPVLARRPLLFTGQCALMWKPWLALKRNETTLWSMQLKGPSYSKITLPMSSNDNVCL